MPSAERTTIGTMVYKCAFHDICRYTLFEFIAFQLHIQAVDSILVATTGGKGHRAQRARTGIGVYLQMASKDNERLNKIDEKIEQLQAQRKAILAREKEKDRKARTRRLIQNGALAEQYLGCVEMEPDEFEKVLKQIVSLAAVREVCSHDKRGI